MEQSAYKLFLVLHVYTYYHIYIIYIYYLFYLYTYACDIRYMIEQAGKVQHVLLCSL